MRTGGLSGIIIGCGLGCGMTRRSSNLTISLSFVVYEMSSRF